MSVEDFVRRYLNEPKVFNITNAIANWIESGELTADEIRKAVTMAEEKVAEAKWRKEKK